MVIYKNVIEGTHNKNVQGVQKQPFENHNNI